MVIAQGTTQLQTDRLTAPCPLPTPDTGPDTQVALVLSVRGSTPRCHGDASAFRGNGGTHNACISASPRSSQCPRPTGLLLGSPGPEHPHHLEQVLPRDRDRDGDRDADRDSLLDQLWPPSPLLSWALISAPVFSALSSSSKKPVRWA